MAYGQIEEIDDYEAMYQTLRKALLPEEKLFVDYFIKNPVRSLAAKAAGSDCTTTGGLTLAGTRLYNSPRVRAYLAFVLSDAGGSSDESIKLLKAMAEGDISKYFTPTLRPKSDFIEVPLSVVIAGLKRQLDMERMYYIDYVETKQEKTASLEKQAQLKREIGLAEIELRIEPNATRIVKGKPYLAADVELDLLAIKEDKEHGRIKSYKVTKEGVSVEMYDAKDAAVQLLKISGAFAADNSRDLRVSLEDLDVTFK